MASDDRIPTAARLTSSHCAYCGHSIAAAALTVERFGERFCTETHAEQFAEGVRAARMEAAARREARGASCPLPTAGPATWRDRLKRSACWGAPLLVLLALPLFWSGSAMAAAGGSVLSLLAMLACPIGMFFMMRAMMSGRDAKHHGSGRAPSKSTGAPSPATDEKDRPDA